MKGNRSTALLLATLGRRELATDIDPLLDGVLSSAKKAWPDIPLTTDAFVRHIGRVIDPDTPVADSLRSLHSGDLFLACACGEGLPEGLRAFERALMRDARAVVASMASRVDADGEVDDVLQLVRERLLGGGEAQPPRIATYRGQGRLANWVRVSARRVAMNALPRRVPSSPGKPFLEVADGLEDPEIVVLRRAYARGFRVAFEHAFSALEPRQRTLLRLRHVDGLDVNRIAATLGRHRVTISRSLTRTRDDLLQHLRHALMRQAQLSGSEADSVIRVLGSRVELSLSRLLAD